MKYTIFIFLLIVIFLVNTTNADFLSVNSAGGLEICINWGLDDCFWGEAEAPIITLISPLDNTEDTDGIVEFYYNTTDSNSVSNCSLYLDNVLTQTDTSITKSIIQDFTVHNPPIKDSLAWFVSCTDQFNNIGNSETRHLDTQLGGGTLPRGGGGTGLDILKKYGLKEISSLFCDLTYNSSLKNETKYSEIDDIIRIYKNLTGNETNWVLVRKYIDYWSEICNYTIKKPIPLSIVPIPEITDYSWVWYIIIILFIGALAGFIFLKKKKVLVILGWLKKRV